MVKLHNLLSRLLRPTFWSLILTICDVGAQLSELIPNAWSRAQFRRFWGGGNALSEVYFVMDSYEGVTLRNRFRFKEATVGWSELETLAGNTVVDGAFSPQAVAMLAGQFSRHAPGVFRVVTDSDTSIAPEATLISYGTSDSNCKTFDIEARSGDSLCRFQNENGRRAFRLAEQVFTMESRDGVLYDKAIVLRLVSRQDATHCHIICAGLSEWGSLAAVHYLTTRWKELHRRFDSFGHRRDFCVLLEVPSGQFESVREVISAVSWEPEGVSDPVLVSSHV